MADFEWDPEKNDQNIEKHGVSFYQAQHAFADPDRVLAKDVSHSTPGEQRFFCFGKVDNGILTLRFYLSEQGYSNLWSWVLAGRKTYL